MTCSKKACSSLRFAVLIVSGMIWGGSSRGANDLQASLLPDEYHSVPGHGLSLNNMGTAATGGIHAVAVNPAMLALERTYSVSGSYHWPTEGREFYQAGIVDSQTSAIAAGVTYTSFLDTYEFGGPSDETGRDSPIKRRFRLGLAKGFERFSLGVGGQYIEGYALDGPEITKVKGTALGLGAAFLLTPKVRIGISGENIANKKVADFAPTTYRAGASYIFASGLVTFHGDFQQRERIERFEGCQTTLGTRASCREISDTERSLYAGATVTVYDMVRVLASYGRALEENRDMLSGGLALVSNNYSFSYAVQRPSLQSSLSHQAVNLTLNMAF